MKNNNVKKENYFLYGYVFPEYETDGLIEIELGTFKWFVNKKTREKNMILWENKYDSKGGFMSYDEAENDMFKKYGHYNNFELKNKK